ncbi:MAG: hypothetical protein VXZ38_13200, partial [Planctomycetota bacterium]|nr:hypothetical protein [Planctomycetota bacterium]
SIRLQNPAISKKIAIERFGTIDGKSIWKMTVLGLRINLTAKTDRRRLGVTKTRFPSQPLSIPCLAR